MSVLSPPSHSPHHTQLRSQSEADTRDTGTRGMLQTNLDLFHNIHMRLEASLVLKLCNACFADGVVLMMGEIYKSRPHAVESKIIRCFGSLLLCQ